MVVLEVLGEEEALAEVVVEALTEEGGEEEEGEAMDGEEEVWTEMEATAEMGEAWVELDLEILGQETGSVSRQLVETQILPGGRNATSVRRLKGKIPGTPAKEEALVEEEEVEGTVVAVEVVLEEAGEEDLGTEVAGVVASGETGEVAAVVMGVASEGIEEAAAEALAVGEVEVLGTGVEGEVVSVTGVVGAEGSGEIEVVAP